MKKMLQSALALTVVVGLSATSALAAGKLVVGVQAPITGEYASEGQGIDNAARLVAEQINAAGGVLGQQIEVVSCDDEGTAMKAAICAKELVSKGAKLIVGSYTSTCAEAAQKTYFDAGVLQTSDGTSDTLTQHGYWTFLRNSFPNSAQAVFTADYLVKEKKAKNIVVLSDFSSYATGLADAVIAEVKKAGGNVVAYEKIKANSQNYTPVLTSIKAKNPDVIYFAGYYSDGAQLRTQQMALGIKAEFVGGDANDNVDFFKLAGAAAAGTKIINVPTPELLPYDNAKEFLKAYQAKYKQMPPSIYTLLNADGMRAILYAYAQNKSTDNKKAAEFLWAMKPYAGLTGPITFAKDGNRTGSGYMAYEIQKDGSYKINYRQN